MNMEPFIKSSFATTYSVELLYEKSLDIDSLELLSLLKKEFGNVEILLKTDTIISYIFKDILIDLKNERIPLQFMIINEKDWMNKYRLEESLEQTWDWKDAKVAIENCNYTVVMSDFMADNVNYQKRVQFFNRVLYLFITLYKPNGINWTYSQKIVNPDMYLKSLEEEKNNSLFGHLNVRYFKTTNNEYVMDTLGLAALGLPDLQCHFKGLEFGEVALTLFEYAKKIYKYGDYIIDGQKKYNLFINKEEKLKHELSITIPPRLVINIDLKEKIN